MVRMRRYSVFVKSYYYIDFIFSLVVLEISFKLFSYVFGFPIIIHAILEIWIVYTLTLLESKVFATSRELFFPYLAKTIGVSGGQTEQEEIIGSFELLNRGIEKPRSYKG